MTQLPRRKIQSSLLKKGFKREDTDHRVFRFYVGDRKTSVSTFISHGSLYKEYGNDLLSKMKRELCMSNKKYLIDFIACPVTRERYTEDLVSSGKVKGC